MAIWDRDDSDWMASVHRRLHRAQVYGGGSLE